MPKTRVNFPSHLNSRRKVALSNLKAALSKTKDEKKVKYINEQIAILETRVT